MITIEIDLTSLSLDDSTLRRVIRDTLDDTIAEIQRTWSSAVTGHSLPGMSRPVNDLIYQRAIEAPSSVERPYAGDPYSAAIVPKLPDPYGKTTAQDRIRWTERGYGRFDIKPHMLQSPHAHVAGQGPRRTLPIQQRKAVFAKRKGAPMRSNRKYVIVPFKHGRIPGTDGDRRFRTITEDSNPLSWWHPGMQARPVLQPVAQEVAKKVGEIVARAIRAYS